MASDPRLGNRGLGGLDLPGDALARGFGPGALAAWLPRPAWVPILCYHRVHPEPDVLAVTPEVFAAHMRMLRRVFVPITLSCLVDALAQGRPLPRQAAVVTFDDGYQDNYRYAFPILQAFEIPATFFVTSGMVGTLESFWWDRVRRHLRPAEVVLGLLPELGAAFARQERDAQVRAVLEALKGVPTPRARELIEALCEPTEHLARSAMNWSELAELVAAGMEIGAHTVTHPILAQQSPNAAAWEILASKEQLEGNLGVEVRHFAYPNGRPCDVSETLARLVAMSGFRSAASTIEGFVTRRSKLYMLERIGIYSNLSAGSLLLKLCGVLRHGS